MKKLFSWFSPKVSETKETEFSRFFREASSREKKRVYMRVIERASAEQRKVLEA